MREFFTTVVTTYEDLARKTLGNPLDGPLIAAANPGLPDTVIPANTSVIVPERERPPRRIPADNPNEVAITVGGKAFRFWTSVQISRQFDAVSTIEFSAPFEPDNAEFRALFKPLTYPTVTIHVGGELLFTGTLVAVTPSISADRREVSVSCYSLPGVLSDCTAPFPSERLQFENQTLQQIAESLLAPFGLKAIFAADVGAPFERVALVSTGAILPFLADLAKQRNLVAANNEFGDLIFQQSVIAGKADAKLQENTSPLVSIASEIQPQAYFSHITGVQPTVPGIDGGQYTVRNDRLKSTLRPHTFVVRDAEEGDMQKAVDAKMGRMFGNLVTYKCGVSGWRTAAGQLWTPGALVSLIAPGAMVYRESTFLIKAVEFTRNATETTAMLTLVLPGAFSGEIPRRLPWED